jgi:hypothetical protein
MPLLCCAVRKIPARFYLRFFLELVAKLTFQKAMRDDSTSQQHKRFMRGTARLLAHPQLPELMQP